MTRIPIFALVCLFLLAGCNGDDEQVTVQSGGMTLTLSFANLAALQSGFHYEGWAIVSGQPVSTGKFNIDAQNRVVTLSGQVIANGVFDAGQDISAATAIVITIEPAGDNDMNPAETKILGGSVNPTSATLTVADAAALGDDFTSATGNYILATPTDNSAANELSGVWFLQMPGPSAGLSLPTLPNGWKYEGWGVTTGPLTTGTFLSPSGADEAAPYSGPNAGPPFPGEDFLQNAPSGFTFPLDLSGATVVISVEPFPDDDAAPFQLKPLVGTVPAGASSGTSYSLTSQASSTFPTGSASIQ
jgi:hypothetical protein